MEARSIRMKLTLAAVLGSSIVCGGIAWAFHTTHENLRNVIASDDTLSRDQSAPSGDTIDVLPRPTHVDRDKVSLGKKLFRDQRISRDGKISCASCHDVAAGGADARALSIGTNGQIGAVNAPTAINVDFNSKLFWDGRASTLEDQIDGPLTNPKEMGASWDVVIHMLDDDASYHTAFADAYAGGVTRDNIKDAIAGYERSLVSIDAPFDRYLGGDRSALDAQQVEGYELFKTIGCVSCHQGRNVGGNMFEKIGIMDDYFAARGVPITEADLGRFNVTHDPNDKFTFRVPSLRLASRTAPYFHDGSIATLDQAIVAMGRYQLGKQLDAHDVAAIKSFIESLAGKVEDP